MAYAYDPLSKAKEALRVAATPFRLATILGLALMFGAPLGASTVWYFENTTLQGTFSGTATVNGYITVNGANFGLPVNIVLDGPFGQFIDNGSTLQLDEGVSGFADTNVDFIVQQPLTTAGLTVDPLTSFTFTSTTGVVDTYSLISGELTDIAPEPGTLPGTLAVALTLVGAAMSRRWLRARRKSQPAREA